jgi:hypothetical protein
MPLPAVPQDMFFSRHTTYSADYEDDVEGELDHKGRWVWPHELLGLMNE